MEKYNGWEDPEWRDYYGCNDYDTWDDERNQYNEEEIDYGDSETA